MRERRSFCHQEFRHLLFEQGHVFTDAGNIGTIDTIEDVFLLIAYELRFMQHDGILVRIEALYEVDKGLVGHIVVMVVVVVVVVVVVIVVVVKQS